MVGPSAVPALRVRAPPGPGPERRHAQRGPKRLRAEQPLAAGAPALPRPARPESEPGCGGLQLRDQRLRERGPVAEGPDAL